MGPGVGKGGGVPEVGGWGGGPGTWWIGVVGVRVKGLGVLGLRGQGSKSKGFIRFVRGLGV